VSVTERLDERHRRRDAAEQLGICRHHRLLEPHGSGGRRRRGSAPGAARRRLRLSVRGAGRCCRRAWQAADPAAWQGLAAFSECYRQERLRGSRGTVEEQTRNPVQAVDVMHGYDPFCGTACLPRTPRRATVVCHNGHTIVDTRRRDSRLG
jgi:hypothetical protein